MKRKEKKRKEKQRKKERKKHRKEGGAGKVTEKGDRVTKGNHVYRKLDPKYTFAII